MEKLKDFFFMMGFFSRSENCLGILKRRGGGGVNESCLSVWVLSVNYAIPVMNTKIAYFPSWFGVYTKYI